jgi:hypothetical protein
MTPCLSQAVGEISDIADVFVLGSSQHMAHLPTARLSFLGVCQPISARQPNRAAIPAFQHCTATRRSGLKAQRVLLRLPKIPLNL